MGKCVICGKDSEKLFANGTCGKSCSSKLVNANHNWVFCIKCHQKLKENVIKNHRCKGLKICKNCGKVSKPTNPDFCSKRCHDIFKSGPSKQLTPENPIAYCEFCNKFCKSRESMKQHLIRCIKNPNRNKKLCEISSKGVNWTDELRARQCIIMKEKNTNADRVLSEKTIASLSLQMYERNKTMWTEEKRLEHGEIMQKVILNNPESYSHGNHPRGKISIFIKDDEKFLMRSSWERTVAELLVKENIKWTNKITGHIYEFDNRKRKYFPDFYLEEYDVYIEVKGRKMDIDIAKWAWFTKPLIIIEIKKMKLIWKGEYSLFDEIRKSIHK